MIFIGGIKICISEAVHAQFFRENKVWVMEARCSSAAEAQSSEGSTVKLITFDSRDRIIRESTKFWFSVNAIKLKSNSLNS